MADDATFRRDLGALVRQLLEESHREENSVATLLREHLGTDTTDLQVHTEELSDFELPNLQLGLEAALDRPGYESRIVGIGSRHFGGAGLGEFLTNEGYPVGPPDYVNAEIGPGRTLPCLTTGIVLAGSAEGPLCLFVGRGEMHGPFQGRLIVQAVGPEPEVARRFLVELRQLMDERDVFRGQLMSVEVTRDGARKVVFLERPEMDASELVLPDGLLERVVRHVVGPSRNREMLRASGRHLARGLLLWGPPGTGKTHTVRYLTGLLAEATVVVLSGPSLALVGAFGNLARRLAPAVVVLEDVDLVAQERTFGPFGSSPVLFELMNEMSGLGEDADVAFVLTTNRPDALEPALAARPGRVDLALEIPLPAERERRRLLELYGRGLGLQKEVLDEAVARTAGATASFFRELLRKAALAAAEEGRSEVSADDVRGALDELLEETARLTRVLLGSEAPGEGPAPQPHDWMQGFAGGGFTEVVTHRTSG